MESIRTSLIILLFSCTVSLTYEADVPEGCYLVKYGTHEECYTFSNTVYANQVQAEGICASSGGRLPIIKDELTWKLLIERFLKGSPNHVWLGYKVDPQTPKLIPDEELTNMTNYWTPSRVTTSYLGHCMYGQHNTWKWELHPCNTLNIAYLCQYPMYCKISELEDPHVKVESCVSTDYIRNNETIEVKCEPGYFLNTTDTIKCQRGKWAEKSQCIPGCPPPGSRRNAILTSVKKYYDIGETVYFVCKNNYFNAENHHISHFSSTCQPDSTWSDTDDGCSVRYPFTTKVIDISTATNTQVLNCGSKGVNITWTHDGRSIANNLAYEVTSSGTLRIDPKSDDIDGFYSCSGELNNKLQIGNIVYEIVNRKQCAIMVDVQQVVGREGENLLLGCPVEYEDYHVRWYKDGKEVIGTEYLSVLSSGGLFLSSVTLRDEGLYQCQNIHKAKSNTCMYNISHQVSVVSSVEEACGSTTTAEIKDYQAWVVAVRQEGEAAPLCYGTLLNENWVVTSGFCLACIQRMKKLEGIYLEVGPEGRRQKIPVASVIVHPDYRSRRSANDIGLLQIQKYSLKFTKEIFPVCIGPEDVAGVHKCELKADLNGTVGGWGSLVDGKAGKGFGSELMSIVPKQVCRKSVTFGFADDKFCAAFVGEKESLTSDDGSPFLVTIKGREYLLGLYTWGERQSRAIKYDYFTSIHYHYDWIKNIIK